MSDIIGKRIVAVRQMTDEELSKEYWLDEMPPLREATVLVLENGLKVYASRDEEGNGPGALFGTDEDDFHFRVMHPRSEAHKALDRAWEKVDTQ